MNQQEKDNILKRLENEKNTIDKRIDELDNMIIDIRHTKSESIITRILVLSTLVWAITAINTSGIYLLTKGSIPFEIFQMINVIIPLSSGAILNKIIEKRRGLNERKAKFSNAENDSQKEEEITRYKLEKENLKNYSEVLNKIIENIKFNDILNTPNEEETNNMVNTNELNIDLVTKINNMKLCSTKNKLSEIFWNIRHFYEPIFGNIFYIIMISIAGLMTFNLPSVATITNADPFDTLFNVSNNLLPISLLTITSTFFIRKTTIEKKLFKKLNKELGENAIESINFNLLSEQEYKYSKDLAKSINELYKAKLEYEKNIEIKARYKDTDEEPNEEEKKELEVSKTYNPIIEEFSTRDIGSYSESTTSPSLKRNRKFPY